MARLAEQEAEGRGLTRTARIWWRDYEWDRGALRACRLLEDLPTGYRTLDEARRENAQADTDYPGRDRPESDVKMGGFSEEWAPIWALHTVQTWVLPPNGPIWPDELIAHLKAYAEAVAAVSPEERRALANPLLLRMAGTFKCPDCWINTGREFYEEGTCPRCMADLVPFERGRDL